jgi:tetratricopeptide (TPR) repeat protein
LALEDAWQRACWTEEFRDDDAALSLYQRILEESPDHAPAHFAVGRLLLERADEAGLGHLERAMALDPEAVLPACELAYRFLMGRGQPQQARPYYERAVRQTELIKRANAERSQVSPKDAFSEHGLPAAALGSLQAQLARYPQVARAYLVRKDMTYFPERPCYVLGVVLRTNWRRSLSGRSDDTHQQIARDMDFPGECLVVALDGSSAKLRKALQAVPGSPMYPRP